MYEQETNVNILNIINKFNVVFQQNKTKSNTSWSKYSYNLGKLFNYHIYHQNIVIYAPINSKKFFKNDNLSTEEIYNIIKELITLMNFYNYNIAILHIAFITDKLICIHITHINKQKYIL